MFTNYQFDLPNVLIGMLIGAVIAFLLRLKTLKRLELKLNKIGLDLGVEGFKEEDKPYGVQVGNISGSTVGDIVGRDKNISNFYKNLQAAMSHSTGGPRVAVTRRLRWESDDPQFQSRLKEIQGAGDGWFPDWVEACLSNRDFARTLAQTVEECRRDGWELDALDLDNHSFGLHVNLRLGRPLTFK